MLVNKYTIPILMVVMFLGTVALAQATGYWIVSGQELVDVNNLQSTDEIKGWMTIQQVADGFNIELPTFYELAGLPAEVSPETPLKDLETVIPDFEVTLIREAVANYLAEPSP